MLTQTHQQNAVITHGMYQVMLSVCVEIRVMGFALLHTLLSTVHANNAPKLIKLRPSAIFHASIN